ncbi:MAG: hypothetical protein ABIO94_06585 [Opitutaceae bacterium]
MKIFFIALVFAVAASAQSVHRYPYDDTDASSYKVKRQGVEARRAQSRAISAFASGAYSGAFDLTSGYTLHLFPDQRAMISTSCDICPTELVAEGTWKIEESVISVDWKLDQQKQRSFFDRHGACTRLHLYLCFDGTKTVQQILLASTDFEERGIEAALFQQSKYIDWKAIADSLKKKSG